MNANVMSAAASRIEYAGIYPEFDVSAYHADPLPTPSLNQTMAKLLLDRSPAHVWHAHPRLGGKIDEQSYDKAQAIGTATHAILLGRGEARLSVAEFPDWRTKEAREFRDAAFAEGREPILATHYADAFQVAASIRGQTVGRFLFTAGKAEVVLAWQEGDIWCRSMIDWLGDDLILLDDLKTVSGSAAPHAIPALMADQGWDVQAAFQERGLNKLDPTNAGRRRWRFIAVEQSPPHGLTVNELPESVLEIGRQKVSRALKIWRRCIERGDWPSYPNITYSPTLPAWKVSAWLERDQELSEANQ